jgi:hypothetical protein
MTTKERICKEIESAIFADATLTRHLCKHVWLSGCSTMVYPITIWAKSVEIQLDTHKNLFGKCIKRILDKNKHLFKSGWFWKGDGSCPSTITFQYTDDVECGLQT